jgi:ribosome recycling factor
MDTDLVTSETNERMSHVIERLEHDFATIRTGRASPALLDRLRISHFGSEYPVNQLATVAVPEARMLIVTPWDKGALRAIEKAILTSDLNLTPSSDGNVIRLEIPALTEERRKELAKLVGQKAEEARVGVRNARRDANSALEKMDKNHTISEDDMERGKKHVQEATGDFIKQVDKLAERKVAEVMEV